MKILKKYIVTYSNNGDRCTLNKNVKNLFARNEKEVKQLCEDLYAVTASFKIYEVVKV